jgi:hypothetical protein
MTTTLSVWRIDRITPRGFPIINDRAAHCLGRSLKPIVQTLIQEASGFRKRQFSQLDHIRALVRDCKNT